MTKRQKVAYSHAMKFRIQFAYPKQMELGIALREHMTLFPDQKGSFQEVGDFMEEVNEELSIIDGERSSYEQSERNNCRDHRSNHRV